MHTERRTKSPSRQKLELDGSSIHPFVLSFGVPGFTMWWLDRFFPRTQKVHRWGGDNDLTLFYLSFLSPSSGHCVSTLQVPNDHHQQQVQDSSLLSWPARSRSTLPHHGLFEPLLWLMTSSVSGNRSSPGLCCFLRSSFASSVVSFFKLPSGQTPHTSEHLWQDSAPNIWTAALTGLCLSLLNLTTPQCPAFPNSLNPAVTASLMHSLHIHRYQPRPLCIITYSYKLHQFFLCWICYFSTGWS